MPGSSARRRVLATGHSWPLHRPVVPARCGRRKTVFLRSSPGGEERSCRSGLGRSRRRPAPASWRSPCCRRCLPGRPRRGTGTRSTCWCSRWTGCTSPTWRATSVRTRDQRCDLRNLCVARQQVVVDQVFTRERTECFKQRRDDEPDDAMNDEAALRRSGAQQQARRVVEQRAARQLLHGWRGRDDGISWHRGWPPVAGSATGAHTSRCPR